MNIKAASDFIYITEHDKPSRTTSSSSRSPAFKLTRPYHAPNQSATLSPIGLGHPLIGQSRTALPRNLRRKKGISLADSSPASSPLA